LAIYDGGSEQGYVAPPPTSSGPTIRSVNGYLFQLNPYTDDWEAIGRDPAVAAATSGGGGGSPAVDHYFDISPVDQFGMDFKQKQFDYDASKDAADTAWRQKQFDYAAGRDTVEDQFRQRQLDINNANTQTGFAIDRERIAQQAAAAAADTQARLAGVQQQAQAAQLQYQVGMAGAANDAERNRIQAAWNATQAQLAREEYALRDRLTTQQNQIAQYDAETKRAGTMGQLALDTNKFILEKSTSPRDLFGLFMMQRGVNPDWDRMAAGQDPGTIAPLVAQDPNAFQFSTPAVNFGGAAQSQSGSAPAAGSQPPAAQPAQGSSPTPGPRGHGDLGYYQPPGLQYQPAAPSAQAVQDFSPHMFNQRAMGSVVPREVADDPYAAEMANDPIRNPQGAGLGRQIFTDYGPEGQQVVPRGTVTDVTRMAHGGVVNDEFFMTGDNWKQNPSADGARPEMMWNPTRAPFFVAPNRQNVSEAYNAAKRNPATRPIGQVYDHFRRSDQMQGREPAMGNDMYRQKMLADYGSRVSAGAIRPQPTAPITDMRWVNRPGVQAQPAQTNPSGLSSMSPVLTIDQSRIPQSLPMPTQERPVLTIGQPQADANSRDLNSPPAVTLADRMQMIDRSGPGYSQDRGTPDLRQPQAYANAGIYFGNDRSQPAAYAPPQAPQAERPLFRRYALGTQEQYEATGNGSLYLPSSTNAGLNTTDLPTRLKMLADKGMPLGPGLVASATGGTAPTLNLGNAVTQGRQAGVLPSLQTLGRQTKSETEHTRGYFEGVAGVPWADIVDYLGKQTDFLRSAQVARAA